MSGIGPRSYFFAATMLFVGALMFGCSSEPHPAAVDESLTPRRHVGGNQNVQGSRCTLDDDYGVACTTPPVRSGTGHTCQHGVRFCVNGFWGPCHPGERVENAPRNPRGGEIELTALASDDPCDPRGMVFDMSPGGGDLFNQWIDEEGAEWQDADAPRPDAGTLGKPVGAPNPRCLGSKVTFTGRVMDPAGRNPIFDAKVYVPVGNAKPWNPNRRAACDRCDELYPKRVAEVDTKINGRFALKDVPNDIDYDLVVQIGRWRKIIPRRSCNTRVDLGDIPLPKNRRQGDLPKIAIVGGSADEMECLLLNIGISATSIASGVAYNGNNSANEFYPRAKVMDQSKFTMVAPEMSPYVLPGNEPRVQAYVLSGNRLIVKGPVRPGVRQTPSDARNQAAYLWGNPTELGQFDIVINSCEGSNDYPRDPQWLELMKNYVNGGGRLVTSHFGSKWFTDRSAPDSLGHVVRWNPKADRSSREPTKSESVHILDNANARHFNSWLTHIGAIEDNSLSLTQLRRNILSVEAPFGIPWAVTADDKRPIIFSADTPINAPADKQCGRVIYSDFHVSAADKRISHLTHFPTLCSNGKVSTAEGGKLSPQEAALEYLLFHSMKCIKQEVAPAPIVRPIVRQRRAPKDLTFELNAKCPAGQRPEWRALKYGSAQIPDGCSIVVEARGALAKEGLDDPDAASTFRVATLQSGDGSIDLFEILQRHNLGHAPHLRLMIRAEASPDALDVPTLPTINQAYSCVDAE